MQSLGKAQFLSQLLRDQLKQIHKSASRGNAMWAIEPEGPSIVPGSSSAVSDERLINDDKRTSYLGELAESSELREAVDPEALHSIIASRNMRSD